MTSLQRLIEDLNERAADSDLLALLAASRQGRLYNAALARELHDLVTALKLEMLRQQAPPLQPSHEIRIVSPGR